jgi:Caspase domain
LNPKSEQAYWLPADADLDDTTNWILAEFVTDAIRNIPARHVLLVSDSCYAGGLVRSAVLDEAKRDRANYLRKMIQGPSRSLLGSGGLSPVSDRGGDGHSVFASAFLHHLAKPRDDEAFTAGVLFQEVKQTVAGRSRQIPIYTQITNASLAMGDPGDFVFMRQSRIQRTTTKLTKDTKVSNWKPF